MASTINSQNESFIFFWLETKRENSGFDNLYGYVYFKQRKDQTNSRGYSQKSIVIMSPFPFIDFFKNVLDTIANEYFGNEEVDPNDFLHVRRDIFFKSKRRFLKIKILKFSIHDCFMINIILLKIKTGEEEKSIYNQNNFCNILIENARNHCIWLVKNKTRILQPSLLV